MMGIKFSIWSYLAVCIFSLVLQVSSLQCKGEQNQDVDWFVLYKIPKISNSKHPLIKEGVAYMYMDSKSYPKGWTLSNKDISSDDSIPGYTLAPFYDDKNAQNLLWLLYNDQPPNEIAKLTNGHTKGALIVNEAQGFWLVHSVPNFPPEPKTGEEPSKSKTNKTEDSMTLSNKDVPRGRYAYPDTGRHNGQSFLCISTNEGNFNEIGQQLKYNQIIVYRRNLPSGLSDKFSNLAEAAKQVRIKKPPYNSQVSISSLNGMEFTSFSKSSKWGKDLYDDFVAPQLKSDLYAETWLNGRGRLPSDCHQSKVMNVKSISLSAADVDFNSSHDHSKWAVSTDGKKKGTWVCVGDINRASTQFERGGGTVCFNLPEVWKSYRDSVQDVEPCPKPKGILNSVKRVYHRITSVFG
ncbi:hypothetical protein QAD02_016417 [Eretmocerus hayati]|uniref:Uncharacterized protein n=1 Tax=Eretmocerus hayati TaxID=131215 RepID=A0ACC2PB43_9HYME|nr:hypothetical protein QAD02_016417 [Eretmocerus hayati]